MPAISTHAQKGLSMIDVEKIYAAKLNDFPYPYLVARDFVRPQWKQRLVAEYPPIVSPGSFPLSSIKCSAEFMHLIKEMDSLAFRLAVEHKFSVDLLDKPTIFTVRGRCQLKDGKVHTDSESKIITVLLYMNLVWENQGGRLRVLSGPRINQTAAEIPPEIGNILIFKRSNNSFHGHLPFEGPRKVIQMNWVAGPDFAGREQNRHRLSAFLKMFSFPFSKPEAYAV